MVCPTLSTVITIDTAQVRGRFPQHIGIYMQLSRTYGTMSVPIARVPALSNAAPKAIVPVRELDQELGRH
jgi:hypothetical protein